MTIFKRLTIFVTDLSRTVDFYTQILGLRVNDRDEHHASLAAPVSDGGGSVELFFHPAESPQPYTIGTFQTDSVDAVAEAAAARGGRVHTSPRDEDWGERFATITDPDGYRIDLVQPLG